MSEKLPRSEAAGTGPLEPEDQARAGLYGVVSRLFYGPADALLLAEICRGGPASEDSGEATALVADWRSLQQACRTAYPAVLRQEYEGLFIGVGKAPVTPYLSAYAEPRSPDRYLVRLRQQLAAWGLGRRDGVFEVEDHISGLSDVMRWLIEAGRPLQEQREFFHGFTYPGAGPFLAAVQGSPAASFYRLVAKFSTSFLDLEKTAFEMDDGG